MDTMIIIKIVDSLYGSHGHTTFIGYFPLILLVYSQPIGLLLCQSARFIIRIKMAVSLSDPLVQSYIVYSAILALKLLAVGSLTTLNRIRRGVVANPEDVKDQRAKIKFDDHIVERTRRAHLNDLENIPAFWILGALYLTTGPAVAWATLLFRVYTVSRIIHTIVYAVVPLPQPSRAIAYIIPYGIKWYMGIQVVLYYLKAL